MTIQQAKLLKIGEITRRPGNDLLWSVMHVYDPDTNTVGLAGMLNGTIKDGVVYMMPEHLVGHEIVSPVEEVKA